MKERLKTLRKALNLSQQEFADKLGVKRGTISNYEIGRNEPIDAVISLICLTFNVNENWLKTGSGEMFFSQTSSEEIAELAVKLFKSDPNSFSYKLIMAISKLNEKETEVLEKLFRAISESS